MKILGAFIREKNGRTDKHEFMGPATVQQGESESCIDTDKYVFFNTLHDAYSRKMELMSNVL